VAGSGTAVAGSSAAEGAGVAVAPSCLLQAASAIMASDRSKIMVPLATFFMAHLVLLSAQYAGF
jgi:hypothetical protein